MPWAPERIALCCAFRMARRNCTLDASCSATPCATSCASVSGFLTSRMFSCTCLPVSFSRSLRTRSLSAAAPDHDARSRGEDIHPDPIPGALDFYRGNPGSLQPLGQHPADLDVLADVVGVELVCIPPASVISCNPEAKTVRIDLLTHAHFSFERVLTCPRVAGSVLGSTTTVMWLDRLRMRPQPPRARGRMRRNVTPSSTNACDTYRSARRRSSVRSALATALATTL